MICVRNPGLNAIGYPDHHFGCLIHVLPAGLMKVRHYGWMSANSKIKLTEVKWLVWLYLGWTYWLASGVAPQTKPLAATLRCASCGEAMRVVDVTFEPMFVASTNKALAYFDGG